MDENHENSLITDFDQLFGVLQNEDNQNSFIKSVLETPLYPEHPNFPKTFQSDNNNSINHYDDGQQEQQEIAKICHFLDENEVNLALKALEPSAPIILDTPIANENVKIIQQIIYNKPETKETAQLTPTEYSLQLDDIIQDLIQQGIFESPEQVISSICSSEIPNEINAETSQSASCENRPNSDVFSTAANNETIKSDKEEETTKYTVVFPKVFNVTKHVVELGATKVVHPATSSFYVLAEKGKSTKAFKIPNGLLIFSQISLQPPPLAPLGTIRVAEEAPQCKLCNKTYVSKAALKRHICLVCPCCKIRFSQRICISFHKQFCQIVSNSAKENDAPCAACSKVINAIRTQKILSDNNIIKQKKIVRKLDYNNTDNLINQGQGIIVNNKRTASVTHQSINNINENGMRKRFKPNNNNKENSALSASTMNATRKKIVKLNILTPPPLIPNNSNVLKKKGPKVVPKKPSAAKAAKTIKIIPQIRVDKDLSSGFQVTKILNTGTAKEGNLTKLVFYRETGKNEE